MVTLFMLMSIADSSNTVELHEGVASCKEREYTQGKVWFIFMLASSLPESILFELWNICYFRDKLVAHKASKVPSTPLPKLFVITVLIQVLNYSEAHFITILGFIISVAHRISHCTMEFSKVLHNMQAFLHHNSP